jgi:hypothetical protein
MRTRWPGCGRGQNPTLWRGLEELIGLRGTTLARYAREWIVAIEDISADDHRGDAFGVRHGLEGGDILGEVELVDAAEDPQIGGERRASTLTPIAMHLASPVAIIIPCPLALAVADGSVLGMNSGVVRGFSVKKNVPSSAILSWTFWRLVLRSACLPTQ